MRKSIFSLLFCLLIFGFLSISSAFAQETEEADVYYVNVRIVKVFAHQKGFYIVYRRAGLKHAQVFIPHEWFNSQDGRARIERVNTRVAPYLSFFLRDGKFEHVKVSVPRDVNDPVWGVLKTPVKYNDKFEGVETLELKF